MTAFGLRLLINPTTDGIKRELNVRYSLRPDCGRSIPTGGCNNIPEQMAMFRIIFYY